MDLEKIVRRIDDLESELAALRKSITNQTTKANTMEEKTSILLNNIRAQKKEIDRLNTTISKFGYLDSTLSQLRVDITQKIEEMENRIVADSKMQDNLCLDEVKAVGKDIEKIKRELNSKLDRESKKQSEEIYKLTPRIKELEIKILEKKDSNEELQNSLNLYIQEINQFKKISNALSIEIENIKDRQDGLYQKQEGVFNNLLTHENRMTEIVAAEAARKQVFNKFIEQQTIAERERERVWKEWQQQFDESVKKMYQFIPELKNQQLEMSKRKETFDEVSDRFERRINEITELYRLLDEKFRQEWATYKSDSEKKWSNVSVVLEEKQENLTNQLAGIKERMLVVEDNTHDMQEILILMSKEIQKGMQSLMNMVNGWMEAFGEIKSSGNYNGK